MTNLAHWMRAFADLIEEARCCPNMTEPDREALIAFVADQAETIFYAPASERMGPDIDHAGSVWADIGYRRA